MWIFTLDGFFSVVADRNGRSLIWRARVKADLQRLQARFPFPSLKRAKILTTLDHDYPFRLRLSRPCSARIMADTMEALRHTNFKAAVAEQDAERAGMYGALWGRIKDLEVLNKQEEHPHGKRGPRVFLLNEQHADLKPGESFTTPTGKTYQRGAGGK